MRKIVDRVTYNYDTKHDAFPYQHEAFLELKDKPYAAIFHEQGLGKTKIAIDLLLYWLQYRDIDTVLIVTKKQLVQNWVNEFAEHTNLKPKVIDSNRNNNFYVLNSSCRIVVANFETISGECERMKLFLQTRNVAIIIDESTKIKNPSAKLTQDFFSLSPFFKIKVIMTGTPVANRPYDIWAQIYFLDLGLSLGTDFESFKNANDLTNDLSSNSEKRRAFEHAVASIYDKIKDFSVRETKNSGIIHLPSKVYLNEMVPFELCQSDMYEQIRNEMRLEIVKDGKVIEDDSEAAIKRLLRLIQATSNPRLLDENYNHISAKEQRLDELITDILAVDEKAIIWSIFTDNVDYFCKKYKATANAVKITGKMAIEERNRSVEEFKKGKAKLLFATPQSAKEGLTLTVANNAIFYDRGFNLDDYLQAQDRIHRISQTKTCNIYNIMVMDSIDIWIDKLLQAKQRAAFLAQGDVSLADYEDMADYSFGDMIKDILKED